MQEILKALDLREQVIVRLAIFGPACGLAEIIALQWKTVHELLFVQSSPHLTFPAAATLMGLTYFGEDAKNYSPTLARQHWF